MAAIRTLTAADRNDLLVLSESAQWNQTAQDWLRLIRLEPEGCFGMEADRSIVASATALRYADEQAWIGMVLTHPAHRGRGYARALMQHALAWTAWHGVAVTRLDASDQGEPLYRSLGYEPEYVVERWKRVSGPVPASGGEHFMAWRLSQWPYDIRNALLNDLAREESFCLLDRGYCFTRPGRVARFIGPLSADSLQTATALLHEAVRRYADQALFVDFAPSRNDVRALAESLGFQPARRLLRMVRGAAPLPPSSAHYFGAGFEFG